MPFLILVLLVCGVVYKVYSSETLFFKIKNPSIFSFNTKQLSAHNLNMLYGHMTIKNALLENLGNLQVRENAKTVG